MKLTSYSITCLMTACLLSACGNDTTKSADTSEAPAKGSTEMTKADATVPATEPANRALESAPAKTAEASAQDALLKRGRIVWFKCRSCHELSVEGPHKVGPNLNGLIGATAGQKEGFKFSDAMTDSGIVWTSETLDAFVAKPSSYVKGTKMAFVGISKESDRQALIKYIEENAK